jgi:sulfite oxidase
VIVHSEEPLNAEPPREALAGSPITPAEHFYVRNHGPIPAASSAVSVGGLVERPSTLSDLRAFARRELVATLQCAGNRRAGLIEVRDIPGEAPWGPGATGTARWAGVSLADVLEAAGVTSGAAHVAFVSSDRTEEATPPQDYGASIPLRKALRPEVLLAWEMNGEPLPAEHGGPLRVVVPGYIGARSVKWLSRIEVRAEPWDGYYQSVAYRLLAPDEEPGPGVGVPLGEVALNADILRARVADGVAALEGYAFAGGERHVTRVEVSADGGATWRRAELLDDLGPWAWRLWSASLPVGPGRVEVVARAWDSAAATQPEHAASVWNPKGYVNNSWARVGVGGRRGAGR